MEPTHHHLKLCTFEVATHLGRRHRLGAHKEGRVLDLNFATAWYMAQTGEPAPQALADGLVPASMMGYLQYGLRASHTTEELFLGSGPHPAEWWLAHPSPRGPDGETLVYSDGDVRLLDIFGREARVCGAALCEWELAVVAAAAGPSGAMPGGYTILIRSGGRELAGPYLVTPNQMKETTGIEWRARVNGVETGDGKNAHKLKFENGAVRPGGFQTSGPLGKAMLGPGDVLEVEVERIGSFRVTAG
jgi:hypothetical protein